MNAKGQESSSSESGNHSRRRDRERRREAEREIEHARRRSHSRSRNIPSRSGEASSSTPSRDDSREIRQMRDSQVASSVSPGVSTDMMTILPDSVRGAPEELKALIRKKQNKESARRSRMRKKELLESISGSIEAVESRTTDLERRMKELEKVVVERGTSLPSASGDQNINQPSSRREAATSSTSTASGSRSNQPRPQQHRRRNESGDNNNDEMEVDEEVEKLIRRCLGEK